MFIYPTIALTNFKLKNSIGSLVGQVARLMGNQLTASFQQAGFPLTGEQWIVLVNLWEQDGITQQELADKGFKNKATITGIIDNLEKRDFVKRVAHPTDRRINLITLTERGHQLREPLSNLARITIGQAVDGLSDAEITACQTALTKMMLNLTNLR